LRNSGSGYAPAPAARAPAALASAALAPSHTAWRSAARDRVRGRLLRRASSP